LTVAFVGFLDAVYLSANYLSGSVPPCFVTEGCDVVTTSIYSKFFGIPVAILGALYYLSHMVLMIYYVDRKAIRTLFLIAIWATAGFIFSLWLLFAQLMLIKELCSYCIVSAITSTLLFILGIYFWKKARDLHAENQSGTH